MGLIFSSYLMARDWENLKFLGDLLFLGNNILFGRGGYAIIFHKASNDQSCKLINSRIFDGKIICVMCVGLLFSLVVENFPLENFLSVHVSIQTLKKVFTIVW